MRLGVGHPGHKDAVPGYVLRDFSKADQSWLEDVLCGISDGAADLVRGDTSKFLNAVAMRVAPARSGTGTKKPGKPASNQADPIATPADAVSKPRNDGSTSSSDERTALQKLMDRFK